MQVGMMVLFFFFFFINNFQYFSSNNERQSKQLYLPCNPQSNPCLITAHRPLPESEARQIILPPKDAPNRLPSDVRPSPQVKHQSNHAAELSLQCTSISLQKRY
jgi:hypothetical protein